MVQTSNTAPEQQTITTTGSSYSASGIQNGVTITPYYWPQYTGVSVKDRATIVQSLIVSYNMLQKKSEAQIELAKDLFKALKLQISYLYA